MLNVMLELNGYLDARKTSLNSLAVHVLRGCGEGISRYRCRVGDLGCEQLYVMYYAYLGWRCLGGACFVRVEEEDGGMCMSDVVAGLAHRYTPNSDHQPPLSVNALTSPLGDKHSSRCREWSR